MRDNAIGLYAACTDAGRRDLFLRGENGTFYRNTDILFTEPIMNINFLDFEQPIAEMEAKIDELHFVSDDADVNIADEVMKLKEKSQAMTKTIFSSLTSWQISQLARHPQRPYTLDYIERIFTDFEELHGDRHFADDHAIVGGVASSRRYRL